MEVGPAKVLSTMGKKTVARNHQLQDQLRLIRRQFLSHSDDYAQICYEYEESQPVATPEAQPAPAAPAPVAVAAAAPVAPVAAAPVAAAVAVDDVPASALDIVLALSAQKLKQPFDQVPLQKCIRDLSGGKTVRHESSNNSQSNAVQVSLRYRTNLLAILWLNSVVHLTAAKIFPSKLLGQPSKAASPAVLAKSCLHSSPA